MSMMLVLRTEIACVSILIFLLGYNAVYRYNADRAFLRMSLIALTHVIFDGVTVYTVNHREEVGETFNTLMHQIMYVTAVCFGCEIFCYILKNLVAKKSLKKYLTLARIPILIYIALLPFLEIQYFQGNGTDYSMGSSTVAAFGLVTVYDVAGMALLLINAKKVEKSVLLGLIPTTVFVLASMAVQLAVVEFLFTGVATTLITFGLFFSVENPAAHFMKRAYIDIDTGIRNKNCYNEDMKRFHEKYFSATKKEVPFFCAVCDLNGLKAVNDSFGHIAGDELIRAAAEVLSKNLRSAYNVYRIGGDEFVAVFINQERERIEREIADVRKSCAGYTGLKCPLSIAIGMAGNLDESADGVFDVVSLADRRMYEDKLRMKQNDPAIVGR